MILFPILTLAVGLNLATPPAPAYHPAPQAHARIERLAPVGQPSYGADSLHATANDGRAALEADTAVQTGAVAMSPEDGQNGGSPIPASRLIGYLLVAFLTVGSAVATLAWRRS